MLTFFIGKEMEEKITSAKFGIFYLCDVFEKLNLLNKQLQGRNCELFYLIKERDYKVSRKSEAVCHQYWKSKIRPVFFFGSS